jgi:pimeloyl-ACP methyl ester carboxylesterase
MRPHDGDPTRVVVNSSDSTPIALWRSGRGPSLVVVHGTAADHTAWDLVAPQLGGAFTVYRMDRRGRGASGDARDYSFAREVDDVVAAVNAVPPPAYLYGHSFGGGLAWEAALRSPGLAGLVLYEGGPKPPMRFTPDELIAELQGLLDEGRREDLLVRFMLTAAGLSEADVEVLRQSSAWAGRLAAAHTIPRELRAQNDYAADPASFSRLAVPVLALYGGASLPRRQEMFHVMAARIPNCRVVELPGQGHAAHQTGPALLADVLRRELLGSQVT